MLLIRPANKVWGKVIFLHLSVILFTGDVSASVHAGVHPPRGDPPGRHMHPQGRHHEDPPRKTPGRAPRNSGCWEMWATSGRYSSYWNAFLFCLISHVFTRLYYRPPTNLREGNIFSCSCLSVCHSFSPRRKGGSPCGHYKHRTPGPDPPFIIQGHPQICLNLFPGTSLPPPHPPTQTC